jgi:hypothetical protein
MNLLIWLLYFIPAIAIELVCYLLAPVVALFVTTRPRLDYVKRLGFPQTMMPRDYIIKPFYWFQTHDNAVDEWWYGMYNTDHWFAFARDWTQPDYDRSRVIRYYCRVMWLWRNCAYGFHYALFSRPKEVLGQVYTAGVEGEGFWYQLNLYRYSFQLQAHVPLGNRYLSINVGWKAHKTTQRLLYANRIIGFRKYE